MTFVLLRTWRSVFGRRDEGPFHCDDCWFVSGLYPQTQDSSPFTMFLGNCTSSQECSNKSPAIFWHCSHWSSVSKCSTNFVHIRFMCWSPVKIASHEPTEIPHSSATSHTVNLLLLQTTVLTLAIISLFLDVDGRPEWRSLSTEVLPSLNWQNQSNTGCQPIASSPHAYCNNWHISVAVFLTLKQNLMQKCVVQHRKNCYDINLCVTSTTYYSQLSKRSHFQLVSWVAKTFTNMSRLVANTSHPVNKYYNSNPDTTWTNLIYRYSWPYVYSTPIRKKFDLPWIFWTVTTV